MSCSKCNNITSKKELDYSIDNFGVILCRACQENCLKLQEIFLKQKSRSTPEAIKLYTILIKMGFNAKLEQWDGFKHIDVAIPEAKINFEIDGMQHSYNEEQALADLKRTYYSFKKGYVTLHLPNKLIQEKPFETAKYLKDVIETSNQQIEDLNNK